MPDYAALIDAETWAFIRETDQWYPADAVDLSIPEQRAVYDRMCRAMGHGRPSGIAVADETVEGDGHAIPVRVYRSANERAAAVILYFHGGGFILGGLDSHDDVCAELCAATGFTVASVDYRLAPEHLHPAAFEDALAAFHWAADRFARPVLLCGDSAGGNLAAAIAQATRDARQPAIGQVLIYPGLGGDPNSRSYVTHAEAPMLSARDVAFYGRVRAGEGVDPSDPTLRPLADTDFTRLPPTVAITAECDPLSSDGESYCERIRAGGGQALWVEEGGLVHGYLRARHSVARARISFARIVDMLSMLGEKRWPAADPAQD